MKTFEPKPWVVPQPVLRKFAKEFAKEVEVNDFVRQLPQ